VDTNYEEKKKQTG
jgi:hypothetical protein